MPNEFLDFGDTIAKIEPPAQAGHPTIMMVAPFEGAVKIFHNDGQLAYLRWGAAIELAERITAINKTCTQPREVVEV